MEIAEIETNLFYLGLGLGLVLLALGALLGFLLGRRGGGQRLAFDKTVDRRRLLHLLRELGTWTHEYRGGVAAYQDELSALSLRAEQQDDASGEGRQVLPLVQQIMQTNRQLQSRLDAAEKQLEDQTARIESYLSEARTDGLTGLANRRAFDHKLDQLFARFLHEGQPFVLALVDIDHFKNFNDTYGHQVGDIVLRAVARQLQEQLTEAEIVARFGGEEFAILFVSSLRTAAEQMDQFRKRCAAESVAAEGHTLTVTLSVGLSETSGDQAVGPLVRRADEALYAAKGTGRNRTYYHDGTKPTLVGAPEALSQQK